MLELNHKKLDVWKISISLVKMIYSITKDFPKNEFYGISGQLRRAAVSIASNIAEGSSRKSTIDRKRFYEI
jgi:four helix bundle protein